MAKELNEDTGFILSVKTLIAIGFAMATLISMWFMLQADIAEAKELPVILVGIALMMLLGFRVYLTVRL